MGHILDVTLVVLFGVTLVHISATSVGCSVTRLDAIGENVSRVLQRHRELNRPVIVRNLTVDWRAHQAWDRERFISSYGDLRVRAEKQNMYAGASDSEFTELRTFRDFIAGPRTGDIVLSFGDSQLVSALSRDITPIPEALQGVLAEPVFTLGHLDTGADFHSHDEVWVAQVRGRKAWLLAPPTGRELPRGGLPCEVLRATLGERDGHDMENCTVGPGEVLFLPAGWFHNTCNLDDFTLGVGGRGRSHAAHAACNVCDAGGLRRALARDPSALTAVDALQRQPIHACTAADCPEGIRHLVARGADPSAPVAGGRERGTRPLHYAFCDKPGLAGSAAEALLELGADFSLHSERCGSLLQGAAFHGDQRLVELLLSKGADPAEAVLGTTPLQLAVGNRHAAVARLLRRALGRREGAPRKRRRHRRQDL